MQQKAKKNIQNKNSNKNECYYINYSLCTCNMCKHQNERCVGQEACENYISGSDYFMRMMNGESMEQEIKSQQKENKPAKQCDLSLGKSKKALKREAQLEAEKNQSGSGFSIKDDPRFKDLFGGLK